MVAIRNVYLRSNEKKCLSGRKIRNSVVAEGIGIASPNGDERNAWREGIKAEAMKERIIHSRTLVVGYLRQRGGKSMYETSTGLTRMAS